MYEIQAHTEQLINNYKAKIIQLQTENQHQRKIIELNQLQSKNESNQLLEENNSLHEVIKRLRIDLVETKKEVDHFQTGYDKERRQNVSLERSLNEWKRKTESLLLQMEKLKQQHLDSIDSLRHKHSIELETLHGHHAKEIQKFQAEFDQHQLAAETKNKNQNEKIVQLMSQSLKDHNDSQALVRQLEEMVETLQDKFQALESRHGTTLEELSALKKSNAELQRRCCFAENQVVAIRKITDQR